MTPALLVGSITLAAMFGAAGLAKLLDREGSRTAALAFGAPDSLAGVVALGVPLAELAIALLLLPSTTRWWAAGAALVLLLVFCGAIARALARGEAPDCHCFGQLHSAPAGWRTLARNATLVLVAAFVVVAGHDDAGPGAFTWTRHLEGVDWLVLALGISLAAVVTVGGYAVAHLLRSYGRVLVRLDAVEGRLRTVGFGLDDPDDIPQLGLAPGTPAPTFQLADVDGDRVALCDLLQPECPVLLLFTSPTCGPCSTLMPDVARWQRDHADDLTIALLSDGDAEQIRTHAIEHGLEHVLVDESLSAYGSYEANGTPSAVLVGTDGTIASWLAAGSDWIESLVEQALAGEADEAGLDVGTAVPTLPVRQLDGDETELTSLIRGETVVLFWNPGCGFCRSMHDDLRAWERQRPPGAPDLIVVAAGADQDVRAEAFVSPVVLDPAWKVAETFGAAGTPMGVLIDADTRIASPLVAGGEAVLDLLAAGTLSVAG